MWEARSDPVEQRTPSCNTAARGFAKLPPPHPSPSSHCKLLRLRRACQRISIPRIGLNRSAVLWGKEVSNSGGFQLDLATQVILEKDTRVLFRHSRTEKKVDSNSIWLHNPQPPAPSSENCSHAFMFFFISGLAFFPRTVLRHEECFSSHDEAKAVTEAHIDGTVSTLHRRYLLSCPCPRITMMWFSRSFSLT